MEAITPLTPVQVKKAFPKAWNGARRQLGDLPWEELVGQYKFLCTNRNVPFVQPKTIAQVKVDILLLTTFWLDEEGDLYMDATEPGHNQTLIWSGSDWE